MAGGGRGGGSVREEGTFPESERVGSEGDVVKQLPCILFQAEHVGRGIKGGVTGLVIYSGLWS